MTNQICNDRKYEENYATYEIKLVWGEGRNVMSHNTYDDGGLLWIIPTTSILYDGMEIFIHLIGYIF